MESFSISVPLSTAGLSLLKASAAQMASLLGSSMPTTAPVASTSDGAAPPVAAPVKGKPGRKPNPEKAAAVTGATAATPADDLGLGDDGDELGLDEPVATPAKKLSLNDDVIPAFRDALARVGGDKSKLAAVLTEYGVKSVQLLPESKFAEVVTKLSKLK